MVEHLQRYGRLTVFKMAAVHDLGFLKYNFLTVGASIFLQINRQLKLPGKTLKNIYYAFVHPHTVFYWNIC